MDKLKFENWLFLLGEQYQFEDHIFYIKNEAFHTKMNWYEIMFELCKLDSKLQDKIFTSAIKILRHGGDRLHLINFFSIMARAYITRPQHVKIS